MPTQVIALEQVAWLSRKQMKISFFLHVTATLHRELIIVMYCRQLRLALILDPKFLYLRGFKVGNSLNVTSLIRHVGGIFGGPRSLWHLGICSIASGN